MAHPVVLRRVVTTSLAHGREMPRASSRYGHSSTGFMMWPQVSTSRASRCEKPFFEVARASEHAALNGPLKAGESAGQSHGARARRAHPSTPRCTPKACALGALATRRAPGSFMHARACRTRPPGDGCTLRALHTLGCADPARPPLNLCTLCADRLRGIAGWVMNQSDTPVCAGRCEHALWAGLPYVLDETEAHESSQEP